MKLCRSLICSIVLFLLLCIRIFVFCSLTYSPCAALFQIVLRGAHGDVLKKVKAVVQYAVFAAYHLALETSFLADEGATLPDCPLNITVALPNNQVQFDRSISSVPGLTAPVITQAGDGRSNQMRGVVTTSMSVSPVPVGFPGAGSSGYMTSTVLPSTSSSRISSALNTPGGSPVHTTIGFSSTVIKGPGSYTSGTGRTTESFQGQKSHAISSLSASLRQSPQEDGYGPSAVTLISQVSGQGGSEAVVSSLSNGGYRASIVHETGKIGSDFRHSSTNLLDHGPIWDGNGKIEDSGTLGAQHLQLDVSENHLVEEDSKEDFPPSPSDHQSILVSMSSRCLRKGTVCERPHIFRIKYYGTTDKPLGRYLRESLFDTVCLLHVPYTSSSKESLAVF